VQVTDTARHPREKNFSRMARFKARPLRRPRMQVSMNEPITERVFPAMTPSTVDVTAARGGAEPAPAASKTLLCVDDELAVLSALKRTLRSRDLTVITATSGAQALEVMAGVPVDLVISDMRMPGMDGAQLLEHIRHDWPDTVRILLTGYSDASATIRAVNRGQIFRYLQKPWDEQDLAESVREGLALRTRLKDEARLLSMGATQTAQLRQLNDELQQLQEQHAADRQQSDAARQRRYLQSVKVLTNLLEVRCTGLLEHGRRVAALARDLARAMEMPSEAVLDVFVAGLLHDIGLVGFPDTVLARLDGSGMSDDDKVYREHSLLSARALAAMEDMLPVAALIEAHHEHFDGRGFPCGTAGVDIPLGARILALADWVDDLAQGRSGLAPCGAQALTERLNAGRGTRFDPAVLDTWIRTSRSQAS
jgi:response regulator RpfG family c-di-GMP phosphodiesterase